MKRLLTGPATTREIAKACGVCTRTTARDIELLTQAGLPIYTEPGRGGGLVLRVSDADSKRELQQLLETARSQHSTFDLIAEVARRCWPQHEEPAEKPRNRDDVLRNLQKAMTNRGCVRVQYFGPDGRIRRGDMRPGRLCCSQDGAWRCIAQPARGGPTHQFLVSNIGRMEPSDAGAPAVHDLAAGAVSRRVHYLFPGGMAQSLLQAFPRDVLFETEDGDVLVKPQTDLDVWQVGYFMSCHVPVQLIGPDELHGAARAEVLETYTHGAPSVHARPPLLPTGTESAWPASPLPCDAV